MEVVIAQMLLVVVAVAIGLDHLVRVDRREIEKSDRRWKALMESTRRPETPPAHRGQCGNRADMRDRTGLVENGPEIALSEGVHRERPTDTIRTVAPNRPGASGEARHRHF